MSLAQLMIGATFVAGLVLLAVGVLALVKKRGSAGGGSFDAFGIKVEGKNGASIIFLIGAGFVSAGFGWASTQEEAKTAKDDAARARDEVVTERTHAESARAEVVRANEAMTKLVLEQKALGVQLQTLVGRAEFDKLKASAPWLEGTRAWQPPPELLRMRR